MRAGGEDQVGREGAAELRSAMEQSRPRRSQAAVKSTTAGMSSRITNAVMKTSSVDASSWPPRRYSGKRQAAVSNASVGRRNSSAGGPAIGSAQPVNEDRSSRS